MKMYLRDKVISFKKIEIYINKHLVCFLRIRRCTSYDYYDYKPWGVYIEICNTEEYNDGINLCETLYYNIVKENNRYFFIESGYYEYHQFEGVKFNSLKEIKSFIIDIINLQLKNIKKKFDIETKIAYDTQNFVENYRNLKN